MSFKSGFVNIIGSPNVGKSTLLNVILGEQLAITSPKAQTTRHRMLGFLNGENYQIVFSDTPGMIEPGYKLHETMMGYVDEALEDADVLVLITDPEGNTPPEKFMVALQNTSTPLLLLINKMDLCSPEQLELLINTWHERLPKARIAPVSALHKANIELLVHEIINLLPEHPPYYDPEELTDRPMRFFVSEIIREKILMQYGQEIPYACEVTIESYKEGETLDRIQAVIYVSRESQKAIIIGKGGLKLKRVGTDARKDIEKLADKQVFLDLRVKVRDNWRNNPSLIKRFGY